MLIFLRGRENCSIALKRPGTEELRLMGVCTPPRPNDLVSPSRSTLVWRSVHTAHS